MGFLGWVLSILGVFTVFCFIIFLGAKVTPATLHIDLYPISQPHQAARDERDQDALSLHHPYTHVNISDHVAICAESVLRKLSLAWLDPAVTRPITASVSGNVEDGRRLQAISLTSSPIKASRTACEPPGSSFQFIKLPARMET